MKIDMLKFPQDRIVGLQVTECRFNQVRLFIHPHIGNHVKALRFRQARGGMNQRGNDFIVSLRRHLGQYHRILPGRIQSKMLSSICDQRRNVFFQETPRQAVVIRGGCMPDQGRGNVFRRVVELAAEYPGLFQRMGSQPSEHEFQISGIDRHAELGFRGQCDDVTGILLCPSFQHGLVPGIGSEVGIFFKNIRMQSPVQLMIASVLLPDHPGKQCFQTCLLDFPGNDKIILQQDIALRFFCIGT